MRLAPQQYTETIQEAYQNKNQITNNICDNEFTSGGHQNLNMNHNQPNNLFTYKTSKILDHQPTYPYTVMNEGQYYGHLNGPSHMTSHPPINSVGPNLVSQFTSYPTLNPQPQMSAYTSPFHNVPFSQENHINQYLKEVHQLKQEEARLQLQLNPNPGILIYIY
ncbi:MAG: hypothetical protein GY739_05915, partial [Mesoflavibacter sp.]|nr:hypothetical protein [Mesoflavibacter sp.]